MKRDSGGSSWIHYGWIVMAMGMLTTVGAHGFGRMAYTLILPPMKDGLHFTYAQLGLIGTGNFIGYLSLAIIGGFLAAKFGTRIVITLALILMGMTMILTGLAESFGFAFGMRLLTGFGNGAAYVPAMVMKVLPNGYLVVSGTREIMVNNETQYITLSGIIRPDDIGSANEISSTFMADARIVYSGTGPLADKQKPGWLGRVIDHVWPF